MHPDLKSRLGQATRTTLRDRSVVALLLTAAVVGGIFLSRRDSKPTMYPDQFWAMKAAWQHCADMVLMGDSRAYIGVSPEAMRQALPGRTILNFGFSGSGYSQEYLQRARSVLREDGSRIIVLGITPHSLTSGALNRNGFIQTMKDFGSKKEWGAAEDLRASLGVLAEPMTFENAVNAMVHWNKVRPHTNDYRPDGWVSVQKMRDDYGQVLKDYIAMFENDKAQPAIIDGLLQQVRQWRKEGVRVYAFRVPTSPQMYALENRISDFDEKGFSSGLEQAGGVWISMEQTAYHSFDGSHLRSDAAIQLSLDLGRKIAASEAAGTR
jgi:hypothetical protein